MIAKYFNVQPEGEGRRLAGDNGAWDWTIYLLGNFHEPSGILHITLADLGIARMSQDLIDAPSGHDVTAHEEGDQVSFQV